MPAFAFTSPVIYVGQYDITCDLNKIEGAYEPDFIDVTTFCSGGWHSRIQGLIDTSFTAEGFQDFTSAAAIDSSSAPLLGSVAVVTVGVNSPTGGAAGDPAYLFQALSVGKQQQATIGDASKFTLPFKGKSQMVPGYISAPRASRSASGSASVVQAGTSSNGQVFATRHVISSAGNLASWIEQATNVGMVNAVTRATFTTTSSAGGEWVSASVTTTAGSYWRAQWVTSSANDFVISFAIR